MKLDDIATKGDIERMKCELVELIKSMGVKPRPHLFNVAEACEYLGGMKPQTLRQKCCTGEIASHKAGGLRFTVEDLDAYVSRCRRMSNTDIDREARK